MSFFPVARLLVWVLGCLRVWVGCLRPCERIGLASAFSHQAEPRAIGLQKPQPGSRLGDEHGKALLQFQLTMATLGTTQTRNVSLVLQGVV